MRRDSLLLIALLTACSSKSPVDTPSAENNVIGGFDAASASLNAIGTVGFNQNGQFGFFCTATLIGPRTVITAKHCALDFSPQSPPDAGGEDPDAAPAPAPNTAPRRFMDEGQVVFGIGPNASQPIRTIAVTDVVVSPIDTGGFVGLGSDVSVYTLAEDVTDITPMKFASGPPDPSLVGQTLTIVGYGFQDEKKTLIGTRRAGSVTIRAVTGKALAAIFKTPQDFFDAVAQLDGQPFVDANKADFQQLYDTPLIDQYELYAGAAPNNAQACNGDSGGPLLQKLPDGSRQVIAVSSGVVSTTRLPCTMGSAHATFGPKVQDMIAGAMNDPCNGVTTKGQCDGTVASRCTTPDEGPRALVKEDCGDLGLVCGLDANGAAACVDADAADASFDAPPPPPPLDGGTD
jgi:hypothetical protein